MAKKKTGRKIVVTMDECEEHAETLISLAAAIRKEIKRAGDAGITEVVMDGTKQAERGTEEFKRFVMNLRFAIIHKSDPL